MKIHSAVLEWLHAYRWTERLTEREKGEEKALKRKRWRKKIKMGNINSLAINSKFDDRSPV
jgi:hypothetical protein